MRDFQEFADNVEFIIGVVFIFILLTAFSIVFDLGKYNVTRKDKRPRKKGGGDGSED